MITKINKLEYRKAVELIELIGKLISTDKSLTNLFFLKGGSANSQN